ncbi:hypothetical protein TSOC_003852 [Tetrabaena socialis]|uniref:RAP domain-containing protein n=1 Tax=Tetrabaena socialis TaxID=47790 RepID=A0A2J8AAI2_9CHLO|nr:hypothetical protein TSOC_003852 [Tetrabaena socialis]|eukprot:PNH09527.1 hypothetical protein TSOC_003852 [Tetrabaena socialis]
MASRDAGPFELEQLIQLWQVQQEELAHADGCSELADILAAAGGAAGSQQGSLLSAMQHMATEDRGMVDGAISDRQHQVASALGRLQRRQQLPTGVSSIASVSGEQVVEGMVGRVDVVVGLAGGRPAHFLANDPHICEGNGSTQLRDRQLERLFGAGIVVSVPYWERRDLGRDKGAQEGYLLHLLDLECKG